MTLSRRNFLLGTTALVAAAATAAFVGTPKKTPPSVWRGYTVETGAWHQYTVKYKMAALDNMDSE